MIRFLAFAVLRLGATSWAQTRPPILEQIAKTYGLDSWDKIQAIRYTWNGEIPGLFKVSHAWAAHASRSLLNLPFVRAWSIPHLSLMVFMRTIAV